MCKSKSSRRTAGLSVLPTVQPPSAPIDASAFPPPAYEEKEGPDVSTELPHLQDLEISRRGGAAYLIAEPRAGPCSGRLLWRRRSGVQVTGGDDVCYRERGYVGVVGRWNTYWGMKKMAVALEVVGKGEGVERGGVVERGEAGKDGKKEGCLMKKSRRRLGNDGGKRCCAGKRKHFQIMVPNADGSVGESKVEEDPLNGEKNAGVENY